MNIQHTTSDKYIHEFDIEIIKGLTITINPGEVHAIMGPNGSGKSTLSKIIISISPNK